MPVPLDQLLLFLGGSILITIVPGPDMALVFRQVLLGGTKLAQRTIFGNLSGLVVQGVSFSQNVQKAIATILQQVSADPPVYKVELLFSFKGVKRVDLPEERIHSV